MTPGGGDFVVTGGDFVVGFGRAVGLVGLGAGAAPPDPLNLMSSMAMSPAQLLPLTARKDIDAGFGRLICAFFQPCPWFPLFDQTFLVPAKTDNSPIAVPYML